MHSGDNPADALALDAARPLVTGSLPEADPTPIGVLRLSPAPIFCPRFEQNGAAQRHGRPHCAFRHLGETLRGTDESARYTGFSQLPMIMPVLPPVRETG